jgi:hypothetical protein
MAGALRLGNPALTLGGRRRAGGLSYWHQVGGAFAKMDPEMPGRAYAFAAAFIRRGR